MGKFFKEALEGISNVDRTSISDAVNDAYKTIDTLAMYARQKSDSVIWNLMKVSPSEMCDFNTRNGVFMLRLMRLNDQEKKITLNALGVDAVYNGDSTAITESAISPSYAKEMNYKDLFAKNLSAYEKSGQETTRKAIDTKPYQDIVNLYPDDNNTGTFDNKWKTSNQNSLLNKTKKLYNQHKINTIISRFHTDPTTPEKAYDIRTSYGLSHGRNLLTKKAEKNGGTYARNGYDNPYCRVWTHHYQYDKLTKMMRPFYVGEGDNIELRKISDIHKWKTFETEEKDGKKEWGWKDKNDNWLNSVLNSENGMLNIVPKYNDGGNSNIHTKQCMFSIENLAWRDYDPYSFEKALSWEQRGPMGGRIMWFPPYGISFTETTSTQWANHSFIGRGEDVYTYTNTIRTGTLNFMLVVDHPSVLDYVSWYDGTKVTDTDVYRFFAGCDPMDSNSEDSILGHVKPTPLTDEYTEDIKVYNPVAAEAKKKPQPTENISPTEPIELVFYVFFPNNYSGVYDRVEKNESGVEAIPYLLYGRGAQMQNSAESILREKEKNGVDYTLLDFSLPISFTKENMTNWGTGYEMDSEIGEQYSNNFIVGCTTNASNERIVWPSTSGNKYTSFIKETKKWYYRIDGEYKIEVDGTGNYQQNYYNQRLKSQSSYKDNDCLHLNKDITNVIELFYPNENNVEQLKLYSLAEIASVFACEEIVDRLNIEDKTRIEELKSYFENNTISDIKIESYANSQGHLDLNKKLAENRGITIKDWLCKSCGINNDVIHPQEPEVIDINIEDASSNDAKKWRSSKVTISLNTVENKLQSETDQKPKYYEFNEDIWHEWINKINQAVKDIMFFSKEDLDTNKITKIKETVYKVLRELEFYQDILETYREDIEGLYTDEYSADSIDISFNLGVISVANSDIFTIFNNLNNYLSESFGAKFENKENFDKTLGAELKNQINNLKKFKNYLSKVAKYANNSSNINNQIEQCKSDIEKVKQDIEYYKNIKEEEAIKKSGYTTKISEYTNKLNSETDTNKKKEYQHEIDKYKNLINECDKIIKRNIGYIEDKQGKDGKSGELGKLNKKLGELNAALSKNQEECKKNTEIPKLEESDIKGVIKNYVKSKKDSIDDYFLNEIVKSVSEKVVDKQDINLSEKGDSLVIIFNDSIWQTYDDKIKEYSNDENRSVVVNQTMLKAAILKLKCKIINLDNKEVYLTDLNKTAFDELVRDLENRELYMDVDEGNKDNFKDKVKNCFNDIYVCTQELTPNSFDNKTGFELINRIANALEKKTQALDNSQFKGFSEHINETDGSVYYINENETEPSKMGLHWIYDKKNQQFVLKVKTGETERVSKNADGTFSGNTNKIRYDQEYHFFKVLKEQNRIGYEALMDKIKYFDPAFHSMTPEGFNARLTFLNQCMRQGNTSTVSDTSPSSANNLAFGRPPYCVLRLGDFYNQMIVIDNISISYDTGNGLQWDLNQEGIGVQPLLANVSISFKFIGGGDLGGPVKRLQNAMTFNYYANTSLYDNRADRMIYGWSEKTNGALDDNRQIDKENSYFYLTKQYDTEVINDLTKKKK